MDKKYIRSILNSTSMINTINQKKILCGHRISEFYFFRIFIESFSTVDIKVTVEDKVIPYWGIERTSEKDFEIRKTIIFQKGLEEFNVSFDQRMLNDKIKEYNSRLEYIGFMESTILLIEIFLYILG